MAGNFLKAGLALGIAILIGRISGLVRELLIAHRFGISDVADQLVILLVFPDILTAILGTSALLYTLVPQFKTQPTATISSFYVQSLTVTLIIFSLIAALTILFASQITTLLAPGFSVQKMDTVRTYIPLFALMIPLTALAGVSTSRLHSRDHYITSGFGALIVNTAIIIGIISSFFLENSVFKLVAIALLLGGFVRFISQHLMLHRDTKWTGSFRSNLLTTDLGKRYFQAVLSGSLFLTLPVFARAFASQDNGAIATFNYAVKLAELPMGVAISIIPVILLPKMTASLKKGQPGAAEALSKDTVYANLALSLSIGIPGAWTATTIVDILYGRGSFSGSELSSISALVTIALLGLPAHGMLNHFLSVLHAAKRTTPILLTAIITAVTFYILAQTLYQTLQLPGLMAALYLSYFVGACVLALTTKITLNWKLSAVGISLLNLKLVALNIILLTLVWSVNLGHTASIISNIALATLWGSLSLAGAFMIYVADKKREDEAAA